MNYIYNITLDLTEEESQTSTTQEVSVSLAKVRNKMQTVISGLQFSLDPTLSSEKELLTKLKKKICHSNGFINAEGSYVMQGEHQSAVCQYLRGLGITKIVVSGTR